MQFAVTNWYWDLTLQKLSPVHFFVLSTRSSFCGFSLGAASRLVLCTVSWCCLMYSITSSCSSSSMFLGLRGAHLFSFFFSPFFYCSYHFRPPTSSPDASRLKNVAVSVGVPCRCLRQRSGHLEYVPSVGRPYQFFVTTERSATTSVSIAIH